jgi:signal transduction histidine kinase
VILSGHVTVRVDRGIGPRRVIDWWPGDVTGMLPYSRMKAPPGDNYLEEDSELLAIPVRHFPEMTRECPEFTAYTVHLMLDRARTFNTSALQDEKMISLGRLAAGLAHELNNPASASARGADILLDMLADVDAAARALGAADLGRADFDAIVAARDRCLAKGRDPSPIEQADREDEILDWLERHGVDPDLAGPLADAGSDPETLDELVAAAPAEALDPVLRWISAGCNMRSVAEDIRIATRRIHELVTAVKRFTYMDRLAGPEPVDVGDSLRDTVRVMAAKAKENGVTVTLEIDPDMPPVRGIGSELNQVWMNLLDNAIDAAAGGSRVEIRAGRELERVAVRMVDDGPGIPPDVLPHIFDPFFTTKPPGSGTGLGLDIALRLARRSDGDITVESAPGRTEFTVSLPIAE